MADIADGRKTTIKLFAFNGIKMDTTQNIQINPSNNKK
jgi:hypothetical protein